jgi:16S rRNA G966 N2-methylase RsmD
MGKKSRSTNPTPVETVRHKDKRANIPTVELRDFVAKEEETPFTVRYARNPDLDPQFVWKGKVQMIYIDPPYSIKFGSNWQVSTRKRDVKHGKADDLVRQPEQVQAFRDT